MAFCLLIPSNIFKQIKFNESFDKGCYEDNVLCEELTKKGYTIWISAKARVNHNNPSRSFEANQLNYLEVLSKNKQIYEQTKRTQV